MKNLDNAPERPFRWLEVRALRREEHVVNTEPLFHRPDERNAVIGFFMNVEDTAYVLGYDQDNDSWVVLSEIGSDNDVGLYTEMSGSVVEWFDEKYGQEYEVYGKGDADES